MNSRKILGLEARTVVSLESYLHLEDIGVQADRQQHAGMLKEREQFFLTAQGVDTSLRSTRRSNNQ